MKTPRDPDEIIAAWLEENGIPLPASTRRAIDVAIRTTPQQRRSRWLPRRLDSMNVYVRFGVAALAVLVAAVGAITLLQRAPTPGVGSTATPSPSPSAGTDTSSWAVYTSERYGFEIRYPTDWDVTPSTGGYTISSEEETAYDRITVGAGFSGLYVASVPLDSGTTPEDWLRRYQCPCEPDLSDWETLTVDGQPARRKVTNRGEQTVDVWVFAGSRVYSFLGANLLVRDRALFDAFLSTVRLHPEDAVDSP